MSTSAFPGRFDRPVNRELPRRRQAPKPATVKNAGRTALTPEQIQEKYTFEVREGNRSQVYGGIITTEEVPALDGLWEAVGFTYRPRDIWDSKLRQSVRALIVRDNDKVIGFARMGRIDDITATLHDGAIDPAYQDTGLFSAMVARGVDEARSLGFTNMRLDPAPGTQAMYEHLGWHKIDL